MPEATTTTTTTNLPPKVPDAILFTEGWVDPQTPVKPGQTRVHYLLDIMEPILGGGPGKRGVIRHLAMGGLRFVSLDPEATYLFPTGHPMEKQPAYTWYPQPNGLQYGYLREPAGTPAAAKAAAQRADAASAAMIALQGKFARWRALHDRDQTNLVPAETQELETLEAELFPVPKAPGQSTL